MKMMSTLAEESEPIYNHHPRSEDFSSKISTRLSSTSTTENNMETQKLDNTCPEIHFGNVPSLPTSIEMTTTTTNGWVKNK